MLLLLLSTLVIFTQEQKNLLVTDQAAPAEIDLTVKYWRQRPSTPQSLLNCPKT